jgi:hypothetical protein
MGRMAPRNMFGHIVCELPVRSSPCDKLSRGYHLMHRHACVDPRAILFGDISVVIYPPLSQNPDAFVRIEMSVTNSR